MINWKYIGEHISEATRLQLSITQATQLGGGDSHQAWRLTCLAEQRQEVHYFVKLNSANTATMFAAECAGLDAIAATHTVRVPRSITHGTTGQHSFLVLEYFKLDTRGNSRLLGTQLAALHRTHAEQFGWHQDNTIGVTPQHNNRTADWIRFWGEQRIGFQLDLAMQNGYSGRLQEWGHRVIDALPALLAGHQPAPSLLHGDLWGGNHGFLPDGTPVLFDPAPYYGDREADMAMTTLFGGFDADFYTAYQTAYPLDAGYAQRKTLYNLYHILNHCNMVSGSYVSQAERMMQSLL